MAKAVLPQLHSEVVHGRGCTVGQVRLLEKAGGTIDILEGHSVIVGMRDTNSMRFTNAMG